MIEALVRLGGVASTGELTAQGVDRFQLDLAVTYERVKRVRKGLWALPDTSPEILAAKRAGGRLACVSALVMHGLLEAPATVGLHVEVPHNASRLRHLSYRGEAVVVHWTRYPAGSDLLVVPVAEAIRQFERCAAAMAPTR